MSPRVAPATRTIGVLSPRGRRRFWIGGSALAVAVALCPTLRGAAPAGDVDFETEVRPILTTHCVKCHGPEQHKGGLRLDSKAAALRGGDSTDHVIVPGKSARSDLLRRVSSEDAEERMPPKGKRL